MKKLILYVVLGLIAVYGVGRAKLSERSAASFLAELDRLTLSGEGDQACAMLHDDLEVSISSNAGGEISSIEGGRDEFCGYIDKMSAAMKLMGSEMSFNVTRSDFTVERSWLQPWTAHYTYFEDTSMRIPRANVTMDFETEGAMTLVMTFSGRKLLKVESTPLTSE